jgi:hypothetical protein
MMTTDIETRISILEDRTNQKQPHITDIITKFASVGTLVIALLYTFPLGVWDRFMVTAQQEEDKKVDSLRSLAVQLADIDAEYLRTAHGIKQGDAQASYGRAVGTKKAALISRSLPLIIDHYQQLTVHEMILLAYNLSLFGRVDLATRIYDAAEKAARNESAIQTIADIFRLRATMHLNAGKPLELKWLRDNYLQSIQVLVPYRSPNYTAQAANSVYEWAKIELASGDWHCGMKLGEKAILMVNSLPQISEEVRALPGYYRTTFASFPMYPLPATDTDMSNCEHRHLKWTEE